MAKSVSRSRRLSDVARLFHLDEDQLRYFDRLGVLVPRRVGALRMYDEKAIARVKQVKQLVRKGLRPSEIRLVLQASSFKPPSRSSTRAFDERMRRARRGDVIREPMKGNYNTTYVRVKRSAEKFGKPVQIGTSMDGRSIEARIGTRRKVRD